MNITKTIKKKTSKGILPGKISIGDYRAHIFWEHTTQHLDTWDYTYQITKNIPGQCLEQGIPKDEGTPQTKTYHNQNPHTGNHT